jgi:hypothetical protein
MLNLRDQQIHRNFAHFAQWLPYGGEAGIVKCCRWYVIKADNRDIARDP